MLKGSTGSIRDDAEDGIHVVLLDNGELVEIPGRIPRAIIVVAGKSYSHTATNNGVWIYHPLD